MTPGQIIEFEAEVILISKLLVWHSQSSISGSSHSYSPVAVSEALKFRTV
jgi:hypothetical protein